MSNDAEISKQLQLAIASLDRKFGAGSVIRLGNDNVHQVPAISTGAFSLDYILGIGGFPRGRIVEIFGPESSGKSTLCLATIGQAQQMGLTCAFLDTEQSLDPSYAKALGVNMDDLLFSQPDFGEMAIDIADELVRSGEIGVLVVDSVANLVPRAELEGDMEAQQMGLLARMMSKALRRLSVSANKTDTLVIFTNQLREKIGIMFGNPETTTGGRALRFYASVRVDLRRKEDIKDDTGMVIGTKAIAKTPKNKVAPALKKCEFDIIYGKGVNNIGCVVDVAVDEGILKKGGGGWMSYEGETIVQGRDNMVEYLIQNPGLTEILKGKILGE